MGDARGLSLLHSLTSRFGTFYCAGVVLRIYSICLSSNKMLALLVHNMWERQAICALPRGDYILVGA